MGILQRRALQEVAYVGVATGSALLKVYYKNMKDFSLTYSGIIVMVVGPLLSQNLGLSDACGTELANLVPTLIGAIVALVGRYRVGGVTVAGFRK